MGNSSGCITINEIAFNYDEEESVKWKENIKNPILFNTTTFCLGIAIKSSAKK